MILQSNMNLSLNTGEMWRDVKEASQDHSEFTSTNENPKIYTELLWQGPGGIVTSC